MIWNLSLRSARSPIFCKRRQLLCLEETFAYIKSWPCQKWNFNFQERWEGLEALKTMVEMPLSPFAVRLDQNRGKLTAGLQRWRHQTCGLEWMKIMGKFVDLVLPTETLRSVRSTTCCKLRQLLCFEETISYKSCSYRKWNLMWLRATDHRIGTHENTEHSIIEIEHWGAVGLYSAKEWVVPKYYFVGIIWRHNIIMAPSYQNTQTYCLILKSTQVIIVALFTATLVCTILMFGIAIAVH